MQCLLCSVQLLTADSTETRFSMFQLLFVLFPLVYDFLCQAEAVALFALSHSLPSTSVSLFFLPLRAT